MIVVVVRWLITGISRLIEFDAAEAVERDIVSNRRIRVCAGE